MTRSPVRTLLVDPNVEDAALFAAAVAGVSPPRIEVDRVDRVADVPARIQVRPADAVLIDATRPEGRDLEAIRRICLDQPDLPVVVLTAPEDEAFGLAAVEAGAQDSLVKGRVTGDLLGRALAYAVERQRLLAEVRSLALVDELTGLLNRRGFVTLGGHQLRVAARQRQPVWLLFADLDGMKWINDTLGHPAGDRALVEAAAVLRETFRESDTIARVGGDEFAVFALEGERGARDEPADRLARAVAARAELPGRAFPLALSIGFVRCVPDGGTTIEMLLALADERMYDDKRARGAGRRSRHADGGREHGHTLGDAPGHHEGAA